MVKSSSPFLKNKSYITSIKSLPNIITISNKFISQTMSSNNNKAIFKINSIFPYSTYLARSYSPTAKSLKDPEPEREEE